MVEMRNLRQRAGWSVRRLATAAGVAASTVSRIENGSLQPTVATLEALLGPLGYQIQISPVVSIADTAEAMIGSTEADWTRFRVLVDSLAHRPWLTADAIAAPPPSTGDRRLDCLLAGIAEHLADDADIDRPTWCSTIPPLDEPWTSRGTPRMRAEAEQNAPAPWRDRNIWLSARNLWREAA